MNLPMRPAIGQDAAYGGENAVRAVASPRRHANITGMETGLVRVRSCNCVFRYPSPNGRSCPVPSGSPGFSFQSDPGTRQRRLRAGSVATRAFDAARCGLSRTIRPACQRQNKDGDTLCIAFSTNASRGCLASLRLAVLRPVDRPRESRPLSGPALAPRQPRLSTATWPQAPLWGARPMSSIAGKTPANVTDPVVPSAPARADVDGRDKPTDESRLPRSGAGGFFIAITAPASGQDQEGT